ncbi:AraC family transcriptional regulator [Xanthomonas rydalmerensis]|uniref:AraC family transcriptional regulator n=1 Tax=Xanthomonas rydalmerensis TaxID=3046274 RepID=A0ABZ0JM63_9XANT|nr:AraC family transcriptional regulator [Xanthomonas sp. DM-2023]WOS40110.1 AraC family transcriptional regulator [Xanthomonas sp. DM-2023]WOS44294.1 AraC family transcriptional regulator [Xanthomonas sp. DM-2023]WOS48474.1 AraC family transcriptional regulator [Xanthomonas sp. DM-2023]WOS52654.1 AraC family transcriptional regulator [Xanthomonas sp. DM-2023]WOS56838.1 AraC family transcriptional regulator [Xanthomonas sp. DM-2023]
MSPAASLSLRSYGRDGAAHQHGHVQLVLPLHGTLELEVDGRGGYLDRFRAAVVAPQTRHAQSALDANRFLIVDCATDAFGDDALERLRRQPFLDLPPPLQDLLAAQAPYPDLDLTHARAGAAVLAWLQADTAPRGWQRLQALCRRVEAAPGQDWPVRRMAQLAHLSPSRLHALFRAALGRTPQDWVAARRLDWVRQQLAHGTRPIATIAQDSGYADQSALTHALKRSTGQTPAAYRRRHRPAPGQESGTSRRPPLAAC